MSRLWDCDSTARHSRRSRHPTDRDCCRAVWRVLFKTAESQPNAIFSEATGGGAWGPAGAPPVLDAIGLQPVRQACLFLYGYPEHLIVPLEALHIIRRLNQEAKQLSGARASIGFAVERIEIRAFH